MHGQGGSLEPAEPRHPSCLKAYFIRRLLLIPPTLIGITLLVFSIQRLAPGGPMEKEMASLMGGEGGARRSAAGSGSVVSVAQVMETEEKHRRDRGLFRSYLEWLGLAPRDLEKAGAQFVEGADHADVAMPGTVHVVRVDRKGEVRGLVDAESGELLDRDPGETLAGWKVRIRSPEEQKRHWRNWMRGIELGEEPQPRAVLFRPGFDGLIQGSLGYSEKYDDPVVGMILDRMPVSLFFGISSMVLIYGICLPLGILKALKHRTWLDNSSSIAIFAGYAIPGYALGALLVVYLGARLGWFPIGGFPGEEFESLDPAGKVRDVWHHGFLPLVCYVIGSFAFMTMLMKNNLMENLAADYVRTATAKGVPYRAAVFRHAFRNSIIPIATTFGNNVTLLVAGSILIEKVFDINGFGLLQFTALLERDEPLIMGVLFVSALLMLVGNILSDLCVALVDPRVSYE